MSILQRKMSGKIDADQCVTFREGSRIGRITKGTFNKLHCLIFFTTGKYLPKICVREKEKLSM